MKVIKNYLYNAGYQLLVMVVPLITTPYINRVLGPYGIGIYTYTYTIIQYFIIFGGLGISLYGNRQIAYVRNNPYEMVKNFWEIEIVRIVAILAVTILFFIYLIFFAKYKLYMLLQFINLFSVAFDVSWFFQGIEDFRITFIRNTIIKICFIILIFTLIHKRNQIGTYIIIYGLSTFIGNLTLWPEMKKHLKYRVHISDLQPSSHVLPTIWLFIPEIAVQIYQALNKTMLGAIVSTNSAGFYYDSDIIIKTILGLITALSGVMLPHIANTFSKGQLNNVKKLTYISFNLATALISALMFGIASISIKFAPLFFGHPFTIVGKAMLLESPVIYFAGLSSILGAQFLIPTNQVKQYTASLTLGALVSIFLNIILIPSFHLFGAIVSTVFSEVAVLFYQVRFIRRTNQLNINKLFDETFKYLFSGFLMFLVVFYLNYHLHTTILAILFEIIIGIVIYVLLLLTLNTKASSLVIDVIKRFK